MIDLVLETVNKEIQDFLNLKADLKEGHEKIVLRAPSDQAGASDPIENQIAMSLVKIEEERAFASHIQSTHVNENNKIEYTRPPVRLNLYVLFSATFTQYTESLKFISYIISFFQSKPVFTSSNTPTLAPDIKKVSFEIFEQSLQDTNYLWGMLGRSYLPSVLYKVRLLTLQEGLVTKTGSVVETIEQHIKQES